MSDFVIIEALGVRLKVPLKEFSSYDSGLKFIEIQVRAPIAVWER